MSGRAIISCFSPPSTTPCSAPIPVLSRRNHLLHATPPSPHLLSRRSHLVVAGGGGGKTWANVKSEKNLSESPKYEDDVVVQKKKKRGLDNVEEEARWWQVFPKRWVIVVLCLLSCSLAYLSLFPFPSMLPLKVWLWWSRLKMQLATKRWMVYMILKLLSWQSDVLIASFTCDFLTAQVMNDVIFWEQFAFVTILVILSF